MYSKRIKVSACSEEKRVGERVEYVYLLYDVILKNIGEGVLVSDRNNLIVECNESLSRITGYSREEIVGKRVEDFIYQVTPDEKRNEKFLERIRTVLEMYREKETGDYSGSKRYEAVILTKNRELKKVEVSRVFIKTEHGGIAIAFVNDITELRKKESDILKVNNLYRNIFEYANDAIFIMKGEEFIDCNSKTLSMFGLKEKEEILNTTPWVFSPKYQPDGMLSATKAKEMIKLALSGIPQRFYWQHLKKDGTLLDTEVTLGLIDRKERIVLAIVRDLTFQRNTADELKKLYLMVEQSPVSIILTDLKGDIVYVNPWFTKITGYSLEEVKGKNPRILKSGETSEEEYKKLWDTITSGNIWRGEFHNVKKNGELYWESAVIAPVKDTRGKIVNYIGIKEDITELKKLQAQLVQAQRMEAIGTLTTGIAHDFNNILTAINGYLELIKLNIDKDSPIYSDVLAIGESSDRASSLIRQLLAYSRKQVIEPKIVSVNEIIEGICNLLSRMIGEDIELIKELAEEINFISADPSQIEQILINLVVNARDAIKEKQFGVGERKFIRIKSKNVEVGDEYIVNHPGSKVGNFVMFSVSDNGIGMTETVKRRIFEPFFTTKPRGKGTGMGLSTAYGIIKQNGGFVYAYSERGKGTTIKMFWPAAEPDSTTGKREIVKQSSIKRGSGNVMIVEDDSLILDFATKALRRVGYNVMGVSNGRDALELINNNKFSPDVIISDIVMPEMGGMELYRTLEGKPVGEKEIKFLFTSGYSEQQFIDELLKNRNVLFIEKPYSVSGLVDGIERLLGGG